MKRHTPLSKILAIDWNLPTAQIAESMGVSLTTVWQWRRKHGFKLSRLRADIPKLPWVAKMPLSRQRKRQIEAQEAGICGYCYAHPVDEAKTMCHACRIKSREKSRKVYGIKKANPNAWIENKAEYHTKLKAFITSDPNVSIRDIADKFNICYSQASVERRKYTQHPLRRGRKRKDVA